MSVKLGDKVTITDGHQVVLGEVVQVGEDVFAVQGTIGLFTAHAKGEKPRGRTKWWLVGQPKKEKKAPKEKTERAPKKAVPTVEVRWLRVQSQINAIEVQEGVRFAELIASVELALVSFSQA